MLHGTLGSPGNFQALATQLQARGRKVIGLEYGERGTAPIDISTAEVTEFLRQFPTVDVIAHSQGGLMALRAAHAGANIRVLIGLGACWRGIPRSRVTPALEWLAGPAFAELAQEFPAELPLATHVVSIISDADTVVPAYSSSLGEVIELSGVHHAHLPNQCTEIIAALEAAVAKTQ